jgi:hypothetical protein
VRRVGVRTKKVIAACLQEGVEFCPSVSGNKRVTKNNSQHILVWSSRCVVRPGGFGGG